MSKILFSKFSNERGAEFNIRTDIIETDSGERCVEKAAYSETAQKHIESLEKWHQVFEKQYKNTKFCANHCQWVGKKLRFEYLEGQTLENLIDEYGKKDEGQKVLDLLYTYQEELRKAYPEEPFVRTEQFEKIFGEADVPAGVMASRNINIDLIFQNIILCAEKWNVIDYEWTFDFPIPVNFVLYRALFYYSHEHVGRDLLKGEYIYRLFGITKKELEVYRLMEQNFQNYMRHGYQPLSLLCSQMGKRVITLKEIEEKCLAEQPQVQVYFDSGSGFTEEHSQYFAIDDKEEQEIDIPIAAGVENIRFDPADRECMVNVKGIWAFDGAWYELFVADARAVKIDDTEIYIFATTDPGFVICGLHEHTTCVRISYEITDLPFHFSQKLFTDLTEYREQSRQQCRQLKEHCEQLQAENEDMRTRLLHKEGEADHWKRECDIMSHSFLWRATEPLRKTAAALRGSRERKKENQLTAMRQRQEQEEQQRQWEKEFREKTEASLAESREFFEQTVDAGENVRK